MLVQASAAAKRDPTPTCRLMAALTYTLSAVSEEFDVPGHAFLSYVREDSDAVDRLQHVLEAAGIPVWRDKANLWPGEDWRTRIRRAITDDSLAFIVCFSQSTAGRVKSYQNEELLLAIEQLRLRQPDVPWLFPVRLDDCAIPDLEIGPGRTLASIQQADLFGDRYDEGIARLVRAVLRILDRSADRSAQAGAHLPSPTRPASRTADGEQAPAPAITDLWRLTYTITEATAMTQLEQQGFGHPAYSRPAEQAPPWVRIRAVVACDPLGDDPGWQDLRRRFTNLLSQDAVRTLVSQLTVIPGGAAWRQRATQRRSWLEADLTAGDETTIPAASANLFLPESGNQAGLPPRSAQLTLHIDFAPAESGPRAGQRPAYWRQRFEEAIAMPDTLLEWLETELSLITHSTPATQFGIVLQAGSKPITEMVDVSGIPTLTATYVPSQFTGWAIADQSGKVIHELATQMMLDLSERILHLDGTIDEMSGLT